MVPKKNDVLKPPNVIVLVGALCKVKVHPVAKNGGEERRVKAGTI